MAKHHRKRRKSNKVKHGVPSNEDPVRYSGYFLEDFVKELAEQPPLKVKQCTMVESEEDFETCPICMENRATKNIGYYCNHKLCMDCYRKQVSTSNKCHMCRRTNLHPLLYDYIIKYIRKREHLHHAQEIKALMHANALAFICIYEARLSYGYSYATKSYIHPCSAGTCEYYEHCNHILEIGRVYYCSCVKTSMYRNYLTVDFLDELVELKNGGDEMYVLNKIFPNEMEARQYIELEHEIWFTAACRESKEQVTKLTKGSNQV